MSYRYYIADVFTQQIFSGAQIAVFPYADGLNSQQMQLISRELNLSETVFVFRSADQPADYRQMRIFSPLSEINTAGHPIIAAAFVLAHIGDIASDAPIIPMLLQQNADLIEVNITTDKGQPNFVQFTRKVSSLIDRFAPSNEELASFLNLPQSAIDHKKYTARLVSCGTPYLIVPVWQYQSVRSARFDYAAWSQSTAPQTAAQEILLFAPKSPFADADFHARLLGPQIGLHEDPPVGNAMSAFACYLCSFEFMQKGTYTFAVDRGEPGSRRSVINLEMDHKSRDPMTIRVGGSAVMAVEGQMFIPD